MRKEKVLTPSQTARQIFSVYNYSAEAREYIEIAIAKYNQMSHPHAKIIANRLAKKMHRANVKEFGYPLKAQTKAKNIRYFSYFSKFHSC